jgi:hypothetical protein
MQLGKQPNICNYSTAQPCDDFKGTTWQKYKRFQKAKTV